MKTFRQFILESISNLNTIEAHELLQQIYKHHHSPQDFDEGDITDRIYKHDTYQLKKVPLKKVKVGQWHTDPEMVGQYKKNLEKTESPPIVIKPNGTIIDGSHRAEAPCPIFF